MSIGRSELREGLAGICHKWHDLPEMHSKVKSLVWVGSCRDDIRSFPQGVRFVMGYALYLAQVGSKHPDAKPLRGFGGAGVLEVVDDFDGDTYRAVYTVKLQGVVFALHAFEKKSRKGRETPQQEIELVRRRLKRAEEIHAAMVKARGASHEEED
jgi:phage-related protein